MNNCLKNGYNHFKNGQQTIELHKTLRNGSIQMLSADTSKGSGKSRVVSCTQKIAFILFVSVISFFVPSLLLTKPFYAINSGNLSNIILVVLFNNFLTTMICQSIFEGRTDIVGLDEAEFCMKFSRFLKRIAFGHLAIMMSVGCLMIKVGGSQSNNACDEQAEKINEFMIELRNNQSRLNETRQSLEDELDVKERNFNQLTKVFEDQINDIDEKNNEIGNLQQRVSELNVSKINLNLSIKNMEEAVSNFEANQSKILEDKNDLEIIINRQAGELNEMNENLNHIQQLYNESVETVRIQVEQIEAKDGKISELKARKSELEVFETNLTEFIGAMSAQIQEKTGVIENMTNGDENVEETLNNLSNEIDVKNGRILQVEAVSKNLEDIIQNMTLEIEESTKKVMEHQSQMDTEKKLEIEANESKKSIIIGLVSTLVVLLIALLVTSICLCRYVFSTPDETSEESPEPNAQQHANAQIQQNQTQQPANKYFRANAENIAQHVRPKNGRYA